MSTLKAVVVGAGGISGAWLPNLKKVNVEVAGLVDLDLERAKAQAVKYELTPEFFTDFAVAIKKIAPDFVVDLTTPNAHCHVTCAALNAGCHVIGEKPMAASMDEARLMVAAAEANKKIYMVSQSRRYVPQHAVLAAAVRENKVGPLTTMNCAFYLGAHFGGFRDEMASPLILDMSIHHFDMARMISGTDPLSVYAHEYNPQGSWYAGNVAASCIFEMSNGLVFTYTGSWCAEGMHTSWHGDWRFTGVNGTILYERDQQPVGEIVSGNIGFSRPKTPFALDPLPVENGQLGALIEFVAAIQGGEPPQGECHDNIKSLAMVFAAIESARQKRRIDIKI